MFVFRIHKPGIHKKACPKQLLVAHSNFIFNGDIKGDQEMMDRVRKTYLQDQRYMTTFVRILLVPLSAPLSYDFKGGGESTRDGRVKFTDLTEATGNGLAAHGKMC